MSKSKFNLVEHILIGVYPQAADGTTPGRRMLQLVTAPKKQERDAETGVFRINNAKGGSRNVWEAFIGEDTEGKFQTYPSDPLFDHLMEIVGPLPANFKWETELDKNDLPVTPKPFQKLLNGKVIIMAEAATEYVKEYKLPGVSVDPRRVTYTCLLFDGDRSRESVFAAQGHPMVKGAELEYCEELEAEILANNAEGREARKQERIDKGILKPRTVARGFAAKTGALK